MQLTGLLIGHAMISRNMREANGWAVDVKSPKLGRLLDVGIPSICLGMTRVQLGKCR